MLLSRVSFSARGRAALHAFAVASCLLALGSPRLAQAQTQADAQQEAIDDPYNPPPGPRARYRSRQIPARAKRAPPAPVRPAPVPPRPNPKPPAPPRAPAPAPAPVANDVEEIESTDVAVAKPTAAAWWGDSWPAWDRVLDAMTARTVRKRTFGTLISHRNYGGFTQKPFHSLLGFDAGALKVSLGLRYGILDDLDVGLTRINGTVEQFNTYEMDVRYNILSQKNFGVDLALRVGLSWFEQYKASDAAGKVCQERYSGIFYRY